MAYFTLFWMGVWHSRCRICQLVWNIKHLQLAAEELISSVYSLSEEFWLVFMPLSKTALLFVHCRTCQRCTSRISTLTGGKYPASSSILFAMLHNPYAILTSNKSSVWLQISVVNRNILWRWTDANCLIFTAKTLLVAFKIKYYIITKSNL